MSSTGWGAESLADSTPVVVAAARTPIGRRGGALSGLKGVELLRHVQRTVIERAGIEPGDVDQLVGGCVTQAGEQSLNVTRNAWLNAGFDPAVGATTVDASCGSSQQANHLVAALISAGAIDVGIGCGVESMSRVPMGVNLYNGPGHYKAADYPWDDPPKAQFGGAERIARREGISRADADAYGLLSQQRAAKAWADGRFDREVAPLLAPAPGSDDEVRTVERDEGLRESTAAGLAALEPTLPGGVHTAASTSQVSDGAAAMLWMSYRRARELGCAARARIVGQVVTGCDPYYLLDGPVVATSAVLVRTGLSLDDIDLFEVNEAFSAVVLSWQRRYGVDLDRVNVNGGAIALGHPLGASGTRLILSALHELERRGARRALITMCCGGALGTATVIERVADRTVGA
jgi:acetyl-CoA C-acetyltransferase